MGNHGSRRPHNLATTNETTTKSSVRALFSDSSLFTSKQHHQRHHKPSLKAEEVEQHVVDKHFLATVSSADQDAFLQAARKGDMKFLNNWLEKKEHDDAVKFINNVSDGNQMYATHLAAEAGHAEYLETLFYVGAQVNMLTCRGNSALHIAARSNHAACARAILRKGNSAWTITRLLWIAFYHPTEDEVNDCLFSYLPFDIIGVLSLVLSQLCLAFGDLVQATNNEGHTALELAMKNNARTIFPILCTSVTVQALNSSMGTSLHYAAACGCPEAVTLLLQMGADVNSRNRRNETPLFRACCCYPESADTVRAILNFSPDTSLTDGTNTTPLQIADRKGYSESVKLIKQYNDGTFSRTVSKQPERPVRNGVRAKLQST